MADAIQIIYYIFGKTVDFIFTYEVVDGVLQVGGYLEKVARTELTISIFINLIILKLNGI